MNNIPTPTLTSYLDGTTTGFSASASNAIGIGSTLYHDGTTSWVNTPYYSSNPNHFLTIKLSSHNADYEAVLNCLRALTSSNWKVDKIKYSQ